MQGVVFTGDRELELMTFPDPTPGLGEVVIEMKASGMCGSDLHQYRRPRAQARNATGLPPNPNPTIGGHEPCGVVSAIGPRCASGRGENRRARDGASLSGLHPVRSLSLRMAATVPGGAGEGIRQQ